MVSQVCKEYELVVEASLLCLVSTFSCSLVEKSSAPCCSHMDDLFSFATLIVRRLLLLRRLSPRLPSDFRIAIQDCLSGVFFGIDALPDCVSRLPFRIAFQSCLSGLPFRTGLQDRRSGLPFRIAFQDCFFNFVLAGLKRVGRRKV